MSHRAQIEKRLLLEREITLLGKIDCLEDFLCDLEDKQEQERIAESLTRLRLEVMDDAERKRKVAESKYGRVKVRRSIG